MGLPVILPPVVVRVDYSPTTHKLNVTATGEDRDVVIVALAKALYTVLADTLKVGR